ncbi:MAG TPA: hypothetical protein VLA88_05960 [Candidatus Saccharimonadales bacterium]|nr:hypothetical protein [Candidatus Saccharimonadales bacterium]
MRTIKLDAFSRLLQDYLDAVGDDRLELALRISHVAHGQLPEANVVFIFDDGHRTDVRVEPEYKFSPDAVDHFALSSVTDIYLKIVEVLRLPGDLGITAVYDNAIESRKNGWVVLTTEGVRDFIAEYRSKL